MEPQPQNTLVLKEVSRTTEDLQIPYTWSQTDRVVRIEVALKKGGIHGTVFVQNMMFFQYNRQTVEILSGELMYPINGDHSCSRRQDENTVIIVLFKKNEGEHWERLFKHK